MSHTPGAVRAAEHICGVHLDDHRPSDLEDIAKVIDDETGLKELISKCEEVGGFLDDLKVRAGTLRMAGELASIATRAAFHHQNLSQALAKAKGDA